MPKVPTYDGAQVRQAPLQGGMLQPLQPLQSDALAGGVQARELGEFARAGEKAAISYEEVVAKTQYRDDMAKADAAFAALQNEYTKHALDLRKNRVGGMAAGLVEDTEKWWGEAQERYTKDMTPQQQALLARNAMPLRARAVADMGGFQEAQLRTFSVDAATAAINNYIGQAAATPQTAGAQRNAIQDKVIELQRLHGWGDEKVAQETARWTTTMHQEVVNTMADAGNVDEAKRYLEQAKKLPDFDQTKANDIARGIEQRADAFSTRAVRERTEMVKQVKGEIELGIVKSGTLSPKIGDLEKLDPGAAADVRKAFEADRKARTKEARGENVTTDVAALFEARDTIRAQKPINLLGYRDRVSRTDLEELKKLQENMNDPTKRARIFSDERMLESFRPPSMQGANHNDKWLPIRAQIETALIAERDKKGRDLTDDEASKFIANKLAIGTIKGWIFDTKKSRAEMTPEEQAKAEFPGAQPAGSVKVTTRAEAMALPKGTRFIDPNGVERIR